MSTWRAITFNPVHPKQGSSGLSRNAAERAGRPASVRGLCLFYCVCYFRGLRFMGGIELHLCTTVLSSPDDLLTLCTATANRKQHV